MSWFLYLLSILQYLFLDCNWNRSRFCQHFSTLAQRNPARHVNENVVHILIWYVKAVLVIYHLKVGKLNGVRNLNSPKFLRWFLSITLRISTAHDFCVISSRGYVHNARQFPPISFPRVLRFPLTSGSGNESSGSNHFSGVRRRCSSLKENMRLRSETGWAEVGYFEMVAPRALAFRPLVKGNEYSGNEIDFPQAKLDSEINARFLLNEHDDLYFFIP